MPSATAVTGLERAFVRYSNGAFVLRDVTLLAEPGETMAVVGRSGSGKSTLLRAIAGLVGLSQGRVLLRGERPVDDLARRNIAMVFEQSHLVPFLDVAHNMSFPLDVRHVPDHSARRQVARHARGLRLTNLLARKPATLSRGEASRVGIGKALVREPSAFLLDEPLAHLDPAERAELRRHIAAAVKQAGVTTFWVTHDHQEAMSIGDRLAVLDHGQIVQVAPPQELYARPATAFVADFVGSAPLGLLPARLVTSGGMAGFKVGLRVLPTWSPVPAELDTYRDRPVLLGVRAEDVHEFALPEHGTVSGLVTRLERTGSHVYAALLVGEHRLTARLDRRTAVRPGTTITVGIDVGRAHVFDLWSGRALYHPLGD